MTYVVTENCIKCKYMDCVEVCPVDCFYAGENMLVIHPDECIDCGVCEPECPAEAIKPELGARSRSMVEAQSRIRAEVAEYHRERDSATRRQGMGRGSRQARAFQPKPA